MSRLIPYLAARHAAYRLDQEGKRPGFFLTLVAGIGGLAVFGMIGCVIFVVGWMVLWKAGITG